MFRPFSTPSSDRRIDKCTSNIYRVNGMHVNIKISMYLLMYRVRSFFEPTLGNKQFDITFYVVSLDDTILLRNISFRTSFRINDCFLKQHMYK
jgi:hypothetical protein